MTTVPGLTEQALQDWVGRSETRHDILAADPARRMQAVLDETPGLRTSAPLPPLFHWLYFLETARQSDLGHDGHPKLGGFLPPVGEAPFNLTRRMWAGGRLTFTGQIVLGEPATRVSTIRSVTLKQGRSGPLCFVTVGHLITGATSGATIEEEHDIVYREAPVPASRHASRQQAPIATKRSSIADAKDPLGPAVRTVHPSPVMLFRYSALTFNGHRIHYDRDYCRDVEGYPGLVFHGPLTATLLAKLACETNPDKRLKSFAFKAHAPLFDTAPFTLHLDGLGHCFATTPDGAVAMEASAVFE